MPRLQAVFWDVDGTLADTEMEGHRPAFNQAFEELGLPWHWNRPLYQQLLAIPGGGQRMAFFAEQQGHPLNPEALEQLKQVKQSHYLARIRSGAVCLRPGVARLLNELRAAGVRQWIVTSSGRASVEALMEGLFPGAANPFEDSISANDVQRHKPHPDPYLHALNSSGAAANRCLAVEDSAAGLTAAVRASMPCLVTPSLWDQQLPKEIYRAAAVVDHLGEHHQPLTQTSGPPSVDGLITLEYLQLLLETSG